MIQFEWPLLTAYDFMFGFDLNNINVEYHSCITKGQQQHTVMVQGWNLKRLNKNIEEQKAYILYINNLLLHMYKHILSFINVFTVYIFFS